MAITLKKAGEADCPMIHEIQVKPFTLLLEKYQDFDTNPGAENLDRICQRFAQPFTDYYLICVEEIPIGMLRVCNFGELCRLSPICILPEYRGKGFARQAMAQAEMRYTGAKKWELDTILQEEKLCRLYEKMGYQKTGKYQKIKDGMDIILYEKRMER